MQFITQEPLKYTNPENGMWLFNWLFHTDDYVSSVRHERGKRLWFNVLEVPLAEDIVGAELRIYKNEDNERKNPKAIFVVTAYQLIKTDEG